jgi:hypothetical protein
MGLTTSQWHGKVCSPSQLTRSPSARSILPLFQSIDLGYNSNTCDPTGYRHRCQSHQAHRKRASSEPGSINHDVPIPQARIPAIQIPLSRPQETLPKPVLDGHMCMTRITYPHKIHPNPVPRSFASVRSRRGSLCLHTQTMQGRACVRNLPTKTEGVVEIEFRGETPNTCLRLATSHLGLLQ